MLSEQIGRRPSGSPAAQQAIDYARAQFELYGYDVEVQDFTASGPDVFLQTKVTTAGAEPLEIPAYVFQAGAAADVSVPLVDAGSGGVDEFPADTSGAVALIQRGTVRFADMARNARAAGAVAMVVANNGPGINRGDLSEGEPFPAVAIAQAGGQSLRDRLAQGPVEVQVNIPTEIHASNVIARPASGVCRTVSGGHLDSVPWSPGAVDNASGSGLVLELARAASAGNMTGHCFALWGGEEIGLTGSAYFVSQLTTEERDRLEAYFNYDVVASDGTPLLLGSSDLIDEAETVAADIDVEVSGGELPTGVGSDHVSFLDGGLSSLMIATPNFARIHTPEDVLANLDATYLQPLADLAFALLRAHAAGPDTPSP